MSVQDTRPSYGRALRRLWHLAPDAAFLNHGSFGACPKAVLAEQERLRLEMEAQPDRFFREGIMPREGTSRLREAITPLAEFVGTDSGHVAMVENATSAVQAVLASMPLGPGDEVLLTDHTYKAVRLIVEARCAQTGARPRTLAVPIPATSQEVIGRFREALTPEVRLAVVDHITSHTALAFPIAHIVSELRRWDARVLVDGAHAVGQLPLDVTAIGADWYVSNAHKWLFAPKGTAFLHASPAAAAITSPLVTSHYVGLGFPRAFDYVGTRDYTAWLAAPAALRFFESLDPPRAQGYREALIARATKLLASLGARSAGSDDLACSMRSFILPQRRPAVQHDADDLVARLWQRNRIQAMAVVFGQSLLLRVSAQVYVEDDELEALTNALQRDGWAGR